jgi:dynein heavy chain
MAFSMVRKNLGDSVDPALEPVLSKAVFKDSTGMMAIKFGDADIPYGEEFKLFMTTKLPNPHYMPEVCIKTTIIDFTVTPKGLEDQLLVDVVKFERPDLQREADKLVTTIAKDKTTMKDLEDKILDQVSSAGADVLEHEDLITDLVNAKETGLVINERLSNAEIKEKEINLTREL